MADYILAISVMLARLLRAQTAGVAIIIGLSAPMLLAMTGLAVDVGYWFQTQTNLQSAADAAAMAAANAEITYTTDVSTQAEAQPFAQAAANDATGNLYNFGSSGTATVFVAPNPITENGTSTTQWVATVTAPRGSFFSPVKGLGLPGMPTGTQSATAAVDIITPPGANCLLTTRTSGIGVEVTGGGIISASNCNEFSDSSQACTSSGKKSGGSSGSLYVTGSGVIEGKAVGSAGCAEQGGNGYIGPTSKYQLGVIDANNNQPVPSDPYASLDPSDTSSSSNLPWQQYAYSTNSAPWTDEIGATGFPASTSSFVNYRCCSEPPGAYKGMSNLNNATNTLNTPTAGITWITGGIGGSDGNLTTLNGTQYYIAGGFATNCWGSPPGLSLTANFLNMYNNSGYAFDNKCAYLDLNLSDGGTYIFDGGAKIEGSNSTNANFASAVYVFTDNSGNSSTGAFYADQGNDTFGDSTITSPPAPATYFFDGGLNVANGTKTVTFEPGIYYIRNGSLTITSGTVVTGTGVTFVLESGGSIDFAGGSNSILSAPVANSATNPTNCEPITSYPETGSPNSNYSTLAPYDGTNGKGICGVLIYQDRTDTAADSITEGASTIMNGAVYIPNAPLTISGSGSISSNNSVLGLTIVANSVNATGSGSINLALPSGGTTGSSSGSGSPIALLVK